jgi:energy-converting hydrogenase Eha subunit B
MGVRNRHSRGEGVNTGLFTIRVNCSKTAVAGTASIVVLAHIFAADDGGIACYLAVSSNVTRQSIGTSIATKVGRRTGDLKKRYFVHRVKVR